MAVRSKRVTQSKKTSLQGFKKKSVNRRLSKTRLTSKLSILEGAGLIGCLSGTDVTSKNYKTILRKK